MSRGVTAGASQDAASNGASSPIDGEMAAVLAVSRALARGDELGALLDVIAREAAVVVGAKSASILLLRDRSMFRLGGSYNLSARYLEYLMSTPIARGRGPSGLVLRHGEPVLIENAQKDPRLGVTKVAPIEAEREGYHAMASMPLRTAGVSLLGVLHVYRAHTGPWPAHQVNLLSYFAEHAASAIFIAQLIEQEGRQVSALSQLVNGLRYQTHEYANRLHAISGLLALGQYDQLASLVAKLELEHHQTYEAVVTRIHSSGIAGLVLAYMAIAQQRSITLQVDARSKLDALPPRLDDSKAITILGNLLANAYDAVAEMPRVRRRVSLYVHGGARRTVFAVRDWGDGPRSEDLERMLEPGFSTKAGHGGIGLSLVSGAAEAAFGTIEVQPQARGLLVKVAVPHD